ncbi:MAG: biopolymer transporter ExbB [Gammaproteobacteria bacterium]|jgi:biopolymer transport protein ExbB|nr:biopolymer transporter ExbB [Gammaproteobacteria bacterium]MBT4605874.1 biopolymer transporter ExbB [Thiotrichales bacterium]MBT3471548.1 biopolymer transporter ExbB [Gammaproteobacteria bacterium]MBT3967866.1 biopolymer transporter ExbB [Gammaproteobacteria bacterium]MBT4081548.1 biopolymer transporter ExbB [Gammaproteobacteria bacterium]
MEGSLWTNWWSDSDLVIRAVFITLISLSVGGWSVIVYKISHYRSVLKREKQVRQLLMRDEGMCASTLVELLPLQSISYPFLARYATQQHSEDRGQRKIELETRAAQFLDERRVDLENGLIVLAIIGNSAPFIGLLGTVWGIMHALQSLGGSAMLSMDMVAGPVSEALVATAVGLFAAIPAAAAYNLLVRWLRRISSMTAGNLREMCDVILFSEGGSNGRIS